MQIIIAKDDGHAVASYPDVNPAVAVSPLHFWRIVNWLATELSKAAVQGVQS